MDCFRTFVDAFGLCLGDTLKLALASQVGLELGEHAEYIEEAFGGGRAGYRSAARLLSGWRPCP
jgi:hypothetical protein